jgi:hypothetical protein
MTKILSSHDERKQFIIAVHKEWKIKQGLEVDMSDEVLSDL